MKADISVMRTINTAAEFLSKAFDGRKPSVGIVLGSGLGKLAGAIQDPIIIPFTSIPGFPIPTALGHKGNLICGYLGGKCVIAMQGRYHFYEGHPMEQVVLPIRVMTVLGIKYLFVSNAAGCTSQKYEVGDLMIINDHINMQPNPLIGPNKEELGARFPDMTQPYDLELVAMAERISAELGFSMRKGVYLACTGPTYETPAEYRFYRMVGADAVGMSTVPEVIVARHAGLKCFGVSVITDLAHEVGDDYVTDENEIIVAADRASSRMVPLFERMISEINS